MRTVVLILTHRADVHADAVHLDAAGLEVSGIGIASIGVAGTGVSACLCVGVVNGDVAGCDLMRAVGVRHRRPSDLAAEDPGDAAELRTGVGGVLASLPYLNHPAVMATAAFEPYQLTVAGRYGIANRRGAAADGSDSPCPARQARWVDDMTQTRYRVQASRLSVTAVSSDLDRSADCLSTDSPVVRESDSVPSGDPAGVPQVGREETLSVCLVCGAPALPADAFALADALLGGKSGARIRADGPAAEPGPVAAHVAGPEVLVRAAEVLPVVVGRGPFLSVDVYGSVSWAVRELFPRADYERAWRLTDDAVDKFTAFLVSVDHVRPHWSTGQMLRHLTGVQTGAVAKLLRAAGGYWRGELSSALYAGPASDVAGNFSWLPPQLSDFTGRSDQDGRWPR